MEGQKKCSTKEHIENNAISHCQICKINMCNKCEKIHSTILPAHHIYNLNEDIKEIFTGFCKEENHSDKLLYFCKVHNQLCCAACLCKIKGEGNGQHNECNACFIKEIESEKKNKLKENIKCLEELSNTLEQSINELKNSFEKINKNKEEFKLKIQKIFTNIRNALNDREDQLLSEVDKYFDDTFGNEDIIKDCGKLPNKIKISLEKGKKIDKEWINNELNSNINDCINIENNIKDINVIKENVKKFNVNNNNENLFGPNDNEINIFLDTIKVFGKLYSNFKFKKCPLNINENRKYMISGDKENIITKTGSNEWMGTICENELEKGKEYKWKIKILKTYNKAIMVGVAPIDFDINSSEYNSCGWYLNFYNSCLYSGPPYNYGGNGTNLSKVNDEVTIIMNMNKRTLKFIIK